MAVLLLASPALAAIASPLPPAQQLVVAFEAPPEHLAEGDELLGARILRVNPSLRYAVVEAQDAAAFARLARLDASIAGIAPDDAGLREAALPQAWVDPAFRGQSPPAAAELPAIATPLAPNDPYHAAQYSLAQVRADAASPAQREAPGVALCVLDSGVRRTHEDLVEARWKGGYDFVERDEEPQDERYHGTFVTSVAAATAGNGRGIAGIANVDLYHGRVINGAGVAKWTDTADAIQWCADLPEARVIISMSFSGTGANATSLQILHEAVQYAASKGALLVGSAGNENGRRPYCTDCVNYPARFPEVIAVTSTSQGEAPSAWSSIGPQAELSAPGDWVPGAMHYSDRAYTLFSGTSFSAPLVAGAAALAWSAHPDLTAQQLRARLVATSQDLGSPGHDIHYGHGELDVKCLLTNTAPCDGRS